MDTHKYRLFVCWPRVFALFRPITLSDTELSIAFFRLQKLYIFLVPYLFCVPLRRKWEIWDTLNGYFDARKLQKCFDECLQTMRTFYQANKTSACHCKSLIGYYWCYISFWGLKIFQSKCSTFQNVAHTVIASPVSRNWTGARTQDVGFVRPLFLLNSRKSGFNCLLSFCRNCCQKYNKGEQSLKHSQSATFINHGVWLTKKYPSLSHILFLFSQTAVRQNRMFDLHPHTYSGTRLGPIIREITRITLTARSRVSS